ncbi:MAG: hypothetical protein H3C26_20305 [Rhodocyclaceae bacterium]|nr:hypothetical protein [Rhodocyclaceae bacterium]
MMDHPFLSMWGSLLSLLLVYKEKERKKGAGAAKAARWKKVAKWWILETNRWKTSAD